MHIASLLNSKLFRFNCINIRPLNIARQLHRQRPRNTFNKFATSISQSQFKVVDHSGSGAGIFECGASEFRP